MDELGKHYAKWKKSNTKSIYYMISFIWNVQNRQNHTERKLNNGCYGLGTGEEWGVTANRYQASLGDNETTTLELDNSDNFLTFWKY